MYTSEETFYIDGSDVAN